MVPEAITTSVYSCPKFIQFSTIHKMEEPTDNMIIVSAPAMTMTCVSSPPPMISVVVPKKKSCSCGKCVCDTCSNVFCCCLLGLGEYCLGFDIVPMTEFTCVQCQKGCEGSIDDARCCCWIFTPIGAALDVISCPCRICHYIVKQNKNGNGIPCYTRNSTSVITKQPQ